jgi:hypothetical protein
MESRQDAFVITSHSLVGHWHLACTLMWYRGGRHLLAKTDSAANQFGAPESVEDPRGTSPLFVARVCPLAHLPDLRIGERL